MKTAFIVIAVLILAFLFLYYQNNKIDVTKYSIDSEKARDKLIVHLSDFHSKASKNILNKVKSIKPDFICITGDYINDKNKSRDAMLQYGKELCKIAPVIYITGNHERRLDDFESLMNELAKIGFNVLLDKEITINGITFLGLDENQADFEHYKQRKNGTFKYKDSSKLIKHLEKSNNFRVILSHFPENFKQVDDNNYSSYDFDLQLSGHAHGGQWRLPFIGPVYSPGQGLFPKYAGGIYDNHPTLIVSRGIGNAEFPFRLFNHPEIIVIKINSGK